MAPSYYLWFASWNVLGLSLQSSLLWSVDPLVKIEGEGGRYHHSSGLDHQDMYKFSKLVTLKILAVHCFIRSVGTTASFIVVFLHRVWRRMQYEDQADARARGSGGRTTTAAASRSPTSPFFLGTHCQVAGRQPDSAGVTAVQENCPQPPLFLPPWRATRRSNGPIPLPLPPLIDWHRGCQLNRCIIFQPTKLPKDWV